MKWNPDYASDLSCVWLYTDTPVGRFTIELQNGSPLRYRVNFSPDPDDADADVWMADEVKTIDEAKAGAVRALYDIAKSAMKEYDNIIQFLGDEGHTLDQLEPKAKKSKKKKHS